MMQDKYQNDSGNYEVSYTKFCHLFDESSNDFCSPVSKPVFLRTILMCRLSWYYYYHEYCQSYKLSAPYRVHPQVEREMMRENYRTEDSINDVRYMIQLMLDLTCCSAAVEFINCVKIEYLGTR